MKFTDIPAVIVLKILYFLDLPDYRNLLLTCHILFDIVVPALYRSPFLAIQAYDGWRHIPTGGLSAVTTAPINVQRPSFPSSPGQNTTHHKSNNDSGSFGKNKGKHIFHALQRTFSSSSNVNSNLVEGGHRLNISTSSVSSSASTTSTATSYSSSNYHPTTKKIVTHHRATSPTQSRHMTATQQQQAQNGRSQRPTSLHHRSYSDHHKDSNTAASVSQANLGPQGGDLYSNSAGYSTNGSVNGSMNAAIGKGLTITTTTTTITPLEQLKLSKTARLLQLFIACTSVQPHLPALRYPGYGQQWIRPPCTVDYLRYYIDHQQGSEIMIQCFHLLFADLVHCQWRDEAQWLGVPMAPPDNEAYNVLHQIQKEFMTHNATKIQTLSFSAAHTVEHVSGLLIELGEVRQLELTDLSDPESRVDMVVDFVKWHRKVFGEERLRGITLMEGNTSSDSFSSSTSPTSVPSSPTLFATATSSAVSYFGQVPIMPTINSHHNNIFTVVEMITKLERIDATGWTSCILYLHRIPTAHLKQLWLSFAFPPSETVDSQAARLSDYLERCRTIEQIRVPIRRSDVFKWASNEKKLALICSPILASASTKLLPKIWRIHLQGPSLELMDCIQDAAFAFQDTLQDLEARSRLRVWQPTTLVWDWVMPRLRRLRLEGEISLHFSLETLQRCPALEELSLATATAEDWKFQVPTLASTSPTSQHRKKMVAPGHFSAYDPGSNLLIFLRSREMYRIGVLKKLKNLSLTGSWQIPDMALRRIADQCTQLKELTLDQTTGTTIGGILLAVENMHGLERLNLTLDIADLKLVRIAARKLPLLTSVQLTSLREEY